MKVIIVEDEPIVADLYAGLLKGVSSDIRVAQTLGELRNMLEADAIPDAVILDLRLKTSGALDSIAAIESIKKKNPDAVVIVATGSSDDALRKKAREAGADYFAVKPEPNTAQGLITAILRSYKDHKKTARTVELVERLTAAIAQPNGA